MTTKASATCRCGCSVTIEADPQDGAWELVQDFFGAHAKCRELADADRSAQCDCAALQRESAQYRKERDAAVKGWRELFARVFPVACGDLYHYVMLPTSRPPAEGGGE